MQALENSLRRLKTDYIGSSISFLLHIVSYAGTEGTRAVEHLRPIASAIGYAYLRPEDSK